MGFIVEGSTGYRALQVFGGLPQGTVLDTFDLAQRLSVKPGAIHQLLTNAVKLRLIKKVRRKWCVQIGWTLGPGNGSATIERQVRTLPPTAEDLARRAAAAERRAARQAERDACIPKLPKPPPWPPGFVSAFGGSERSQTPALRTLSAQQAGEAARLAPAWLCGSNSLPSANAGRRAAAASPRRYVARWHVRYADEAGQISGVVQVLKVHPRLRCLDVWCEWRNQVRSLAFDGFRRIDDAETYKPVDLEKWLCRWHHADPQDAPSQPPPARGYSNHSAAPQPSQRADSKAEKSTDAQEPALA